MTLNRNQIKHRLHPKLRQWKIDQMRINTSNFTDLHDQTGPYNTTPSQLDPAVVTHQVIIQGSGHYQGQVKLIIFKNLSHPNLPVIEYMLQPTGYKAG